MTDIRPLTGIAVGELYEAFAGAFADYVVTLTQREFERMIQRRGYDPGISFGAFDGDRLVAFTYNCAGEFGRQPTVYDTGTGTLPASRGRGLAPRIFEASLPVLRQKGFSQYLLEVLTTNTGAKSVYDKLGFKVTREFFYCRQPVETLQVSAPPLPEGINIRRTDLSQQSIVESWMDFVPSWQNSFASLSRISSELVILGAFEGSQLCGYAVLDPISGDLAFLAVAPSYRHRGVGTALLGELLRHNAYPAIKALNIETRCEGIRQFLGKQGIGVLGGQYEMVLGL